VMKASVEASAQCKLLQMNALRVRNIFCYLVGISCEIENV
jgi:hypothetical protein